MDKNNDVPYIVYESESARHERTVKRLIIALVISILMIVGSNMAWLYVFNQYDFSSEEITVEGTDAANANYMGAQASGVINNGSKSDSEAKDDD